MGKIERDNIIPANKVETKSNKTESVDFAVVLGCILPDLNLGIFDKLYQYSEQILNVVCPHSKPIELRLIGNVAITARDLSVSTVTTDRGLVNHMPSAGGFQYALSNEFRDADPSKASYFALMQATKGPAIVLAAGNDQDFNMVLTSLTEHFQRESTGFSCRFKENHSKTLDSQKFHRREYKTWNPLFDLIHVNSLGEIAPWNSNSYKMPAFVFSYGEENGYRFCEIDIRISTDNDHPNVSNFSAERSLLSFKIVNLKEDAISKIDHTNVFNWQKVRSLPLKSTEYGTSVDFDKRDRQNQYYDNELDISDEDFERLKADPLEVYLAAVEAVHLCTVRNKTMSKRCANRFQTEIDKLSITDEDGMNVLQQNLIYTATKGRNIGLAVARAIMLLNDAVYANPQRFHKMLMEIKLFQLIPALNKVLGDDKTAIAVEKNCMGTREEYNEDLEIANKLEELIGRQVYQDKVEELGRSRVFDMACYLISHPHIFIRDKGRLIKWIIRKHRFDGISRYYYALVNYAKVPRGKLHILSSMSEIFNPLPTDMDQIMDFRPGKDQHNFYVAVMKDVILKAWNNMMGKERKEPFACVAADDTKMQLLAEVSVNNIRWDALDFVDTDQHAERLQIAKLQANGINGGYTLISMFQPCMYCAEHIPDDVKVIYAMRSPWSVKGKKQDNMIYWPIFNSIISKYFRRLPISIHEWMFGKGSY